MPNLKCSSPQEGHCLEIRELEFSCAINTVVGVAFSKESSIGEFSRKTSLENKHLRQCDYFEIISSCSHFTMLTKNPKLNTQNQRFSVVCLSCHQNGKCVNLIFSRVVLQLMARWLLFFSRPIKIIVYGVVVPVPSLILKLPIDDYNGNDKAKKHWPDWLNEEK